MIAEIITLGLFLAGLGLCIFTGIQILYALLFGLACFSLYTLSRGYSVRETCSMLGEGMGKVKNILIIFVLIEMCIRDRFLYLKQYFSKKVKDSY